MREDLKLVYCEQIFGLDSDIELTWMMLRTIEIEAKVPLSFDNNQLSAYFDRALAEFGFPGKVVSCVVCPDFKNIFDYENRREKVQFRFN